MTNSQYKLYPPVLGTLLFFKLYENPLFVLDAENLSKSFGNENAVDSLSLELERSEIVGLLGPNGAGKTTTMQMLSGLLEPDSGTVSVTEGSVKDLVSVVFQEINYSSKLKVKELLRMMTILNENTEKLNEVIDEVGLSEYKDTLVPDLSGGNKKKVNIASGLLKNPDYLLLDEPTSGLDPRARRDVRDMIKALKDEVGVLVSTHSMEEAEKLCDRIIIMEDGSEVVSGSPDELVASIDADYILKAEGDIPPGFEDRGVQTGDFFELRTDRPHVLIKELFESDELDHLENLSIEKPGLEDVFFEVTGRRYEKDN